MNITLFFIFAIIALFTLWQLWAIYQSKKIIGKDIPYDKLDAELSRKIKDKSGLIYFFSPACPNCKTQTPIIHSLKKKYENILLINAYDDINMAKVFNIAGTPSFVFFGGNKILSHYVGIKKESFIIDNLQSEN